MLNIVQTLAPAL